MKQLIVSHDEKTFGDALKLMDAGVRATGLSCVIDAAGVLIAYNSAQVLEVSPPPETPAAPETDGEVLAKDVELAVTEEIIAAAEDVPVADTPADAAVEVAARDEYADMAADIARNDDATAAAEEVKEEVAEVVLPVEVPVVEEANNAPQATDNERPRKEKRRSHY